MQNESDRLDDCLQGQLSQACLGRRVGEAIADPLLPGFEE